MNPGLLNKRLLFPTVSVWGQMLIKTKRRDDEQNEENYHFIIRKRSDITEYSTFTCNNTKYLVLTVEEYQKERGYLLLRCEKAKVHSFYDTCTVTRLEEIEKENGADGFENNVVYSEIPCELVRLESASVSDTGNENKIVQRYELFVENSINLKIGDKLEVIHKLDTYHANVTEYFKSHTHQTVSVELEGEA